MAHQDMSLSSEQVQRLLQCAVCLERFKQPKLLPCQHTFCLTPCLEGLVDRRTRSVRCPECRADHFVPRNGPASFPNNLTIIGFLGLSVAADRALERSSGLGVQAERSRPMETRGSNQQPQRAASPGPVVLDTASGAESVGCYLCHREGRLTRCCHCDQLTCDTCRQTHIEQVITAITREISQVRRSIPVMTDYIIAVGRRGAQLQNNCDSVKAEISEAFEKQIRELKSRERALREDVDAFFNGEFRNLRSLQENAEVEIASLASFCDSAESVLSMSRQVPDGDLMEMKRQGQEHLQTVLGYQDGTVRPPSVRHIQALLASSFLSSTIGNFGELIVTSRTSPGLNQVLTGDLHQRTERVGSDRVHLSPHLHDDNGWQNSTLQTEGRASSISPGISRRHLSPTFSGRTSQVRFDDPDNSTVNPRWSFPTPGATVHRRSRYERRSDTDIPLVVSGRVHATSQQPPDRTRHLSLGALPAAVELDEEVGDTDLGPLGIPITDLGPLGIPIPRSGRDARGGGELPATFPGAISNNFSNHSSVSGTESNPPNNDMQNNSSVTFSSGYNPSMYVNTPRNKYNQKGTALYQFGQRGSNAVEFTWPRGIAVSPLEDKIYICDSSNHRVQVFDNTGGFLKTFGEYGQGEGQFDCLAGVAVNGLGQVIIADRYNHRVQIFDRNGHFQNTFGTEGSGEGQLNYPWGIACDNMGFIYVCDKENHRIQVFQSNGAYVRMFGELGSRTGQLENPHYVAVSPDNKVYVSDSSNHRIQVFSMYGDFLFSFGSCGVLRGQMKFPRGIAIDHQGFVVVADSGNNRIQIFRADGRFYSMFGSWGSENGHFKGLEGLAILANGNIVVSDRENHRVQIF